MLYCDVTDVITMNVFVSYSGLSAIVYNKDVTTQCFVSLSIYRISTNKNKEKKTSLTFTTLWTSSADDKLIILFLYFPGNSP